MIVWRCENKKGEGPYHSVPDSVTEYILWHGVPENAPTTHKMFYHHCKSRDEKGKALHPDIHNDELSPPSDDYLCGFDCSKKAGRWFRGYIKKLTIEGFYLRAYNVPDDKVIIGKSGKQIMFDKTAAVLIDIEWSNRHVASNSSR